MAERDRFELDVAAAFRAYLEDAPTQVRPAQLARHFAETYPHGRTAFAGWSPLAVRRVAWVLLLAAGLLAALAGGALFVGSQVDRWPPAVVELSPDEALVAAVAAVASNPYDAARVAEVYAPNAGLRELTANETSFGLEEIGARIQYFNSQDFEVVVTSVPIRQGDFVAVFVKFGAGGEAASPGLLVLQMGDGKVLNQWVYPAP
jgi:anti-sigma factor RsiW